MSGVTMSIEGVIWAIGLLVLLNAVWEYWKRQISCQYRVQNAMSNIHSNALWEYHNIGVEPYKPEEEPVTFEDVLEEEATESYFSKRDKLNGGKRK